MSSEQIQIAKEPSLMRSRVLQGNMDNDVDVKKLLKSWDLEDYIPKFDENKITLATFELLEKDVIKELIPPIGDRLKFTKYLADWNALTASLQEEDLVVSGEVEKNSKVLVEPTTNTTVIPDRADSIQNIHLTSPDEQTYYVSTATPTTITSNGTKSIQNTLNSDGRAILAYGNSTKGKLDEYHRKRLSQLLIGHLLEENPTKNIHSLEFKNFAANIKEIFPRESEIIYFSPYEGTGNGPKKNASGKLYETYINRRRKLRARGELPGTSRSSSCSSKLTDSADTESISSNDNIVDNNNESGTEDQTGADKLIWLRNNVDPWHLVEQYWEATSGIRLKPENLSKGNIADYFDEYPALKLSKGYTLLIKDFAHLYPKYDDDFHLSFMLKREKIIDLAIEKRRKIRDKDVKEAIQNYITLSKDGSEALTNAALVLLAYVIEPSQSRKRGKQQWKPSRSEIRDGFVSQAASSADVNSVIENRKAKMARMNKTLQPFIIYVGESLALVESAYVIIDTNYYKFDKLLNAVDAVFKIFQATGACYPDESIDVWNVIQIGFYKIRTVFDRPCQATNSLLNDLELIS